MAQGPKHSVSVAGVIVDEHNRALLIQRRDNGRWEAPGGVLELAEDVITGLRREVREETGLEIAPVRLTGVYKNMRQDIIALVFRCVTTGGTLSATEETRDFRWVTAAEVSTIATEAFAVRVKDALNSPHDVSIRQHDGTHLLG
ncbi:NUDIX hydrolase [Actinomadura flavalba]|uniref:NUDIX hydrolase n=1 Tax=Actinomadura flavalba TaxID=1120938 RepID=UPI000376D685|nr:NUDIX hydrolase [Actinomadura flavalba]